MKKLLILTVAAAMSAAFLIRSTTLHAAPPPTLKHSNAATASSGAATLDRASGTITSEALTTAAAAAYTLTLTDARVTTSSFVYVGVYNGTNTQGIPVVSTVTPGSGSVVIKIYNLHASQALNGTLKIYFELL